MQIINSFRGEYAFLSNFYSCGINTPIGTFPSAENMFQAAKVDKRHMTPELLRAFTTISPGDAKRLGRQVTLRDNWIEYHDRAMYQTVKHKFTQNPELAKKLIATYPTPLVEGNTWNDTYWGVCNGKGLNKLGKILMLVRRELLANV